METGHIVIENQTGRHIQYRIDHQTVCVKAGKCFCRQGRRSLVAASIHVPGGKGKRSAPLHPGVMLIPELKRDLAGKRPKVKIVGAAPSEEAVKKAAKAKAKEDAQSKPDEKKGGGGKKGQK